MGLRRSQGVSQGRPGKPKGARLGSNLMSKRSFWAAFEAAGVPFVSFYVSTFVFEKHQFRMGRPPQRGLSSLPVFGIVFNVVFEKHQFRLGHPFKTEVQDVRDFSNMFYKKT